MLIFILLACAWARLRGKHPSLAMREMTLLPMALLEVVFWVFQVAAWRGDYRFLPYGAALQTAMIASMLFPILKFRLYPQAIGGSAMVMVGSLLNRAVMAANGGVMPVYPTLSRLTGYYTDGALATAGDALHGLMDAGTKLWILGDYLDVGFSIMSPGDLLIHGFVTLIIYAVIARLSEKTNEFCV